MTTRLSNSQVLNETKIAAETTVTRTRIVATSKTFFQYDVDRKNNRFLVNSIKPDAPLTLVTNWQATPEP